MEYPSKYVIISFLFFILSLCRLGESRNSSANFIRIDLLNKYGNPDFPPSSEDGEDYININMELFLRSVNHFDELNGQLKSTVVVVVGWHDNRLIWDNNSTGVDTISLSSKSIWTPSIMVENSVDNGLLFDPEVTYLVRSDWRGWQRFVFMGVVETKCYANVKFYPFDKHRCNITLGSLESLLLHERVNISYAKLADNVDIIKKNSQWEITQGVPIDSSLYTVSFVNFPMELKRKSTFTMITIIVPIMFLCIVNVFVFLIPPLSGERISFAITVLLAFSVYMSVISDNVPDSDPVPLYNIFLAMKLAYSAAITLLAVISVRIYEKEGDINLSQREKKVLLFMNRFPYCCCKRKTQYNPSNHANNGTGHENDNNSNKKATLSKKRVDYKIENDDSVVKKDSEWKWRENEEVTWKTVSYLLDKMCLVVFMFIVVVESIFSFIITFDNTYVFG